MVREVVEEDVFVVVLRPHADRDEEATRRNIICDLWCTLMVCELFFFFFLVPTRVGSRRRVQNVQRERERERERESKERISLRISHITRSTVTVGRLFPFLISFLHAIKIICNVTRRYTTARALLLFNTTLLLLLLIIITATTTS